MVSKLLIHIGTGKTGSTTLQASLAKLNKNNMLNGIVYPELRGKIHHNELCTLVMPHARIRRDIRSKYKEEDERYNKFKDKIKKKLFKDVSSASNVILSGEYFCGFNQEEVGKFKEIVEQLGFNEVKIVVYFREVCSLYLSQIQQRIKGSSKFANPYNYIFNYKDIYQRWHTVFDDVEVREFSRSGLEGSDIVVDFLSVANRYFDVNLTPEISIEKTNESLSVAGMLIQHEYRSLFYSQEDNVFYKDSIELISFIIEAEKQIGYNNKPKLKDELIKIILKNNQSELYWLKSNFGIDFGVNEDLPRQVEKYSFNSDLEQVIQVSDKDKAAKELILFNLINMLLNKEAAKTS